MLQRLPSTPTLQSTLVIKEAPAVPHLHGEIASSDLPGVQRDPGAWLEQPLHLWPGVGLQVGGQVTQVGVLVHHLAQVEQNRLLAVDQSQLTQTLN